MPGGRKTIYNEALVTDEDWDAVLPFNRRLVGDFVAYLAATDKSPATIYQYEQQLRIFFVWNCKNNANTKFVDIRKRSFIFFFGYGAEEYKWSPARLSSLRAVLSSLSNYVERVLDDEFPAFHNVIKSLEPIRVDAVREKTVLTNEQIEGALEKLTQSGNYQAACYLALLYSSGMRKGEACQMKVSYFVEENTAFDIMYRTPKIRTKGRGKRGKQVHRYVFKYTFQPYLDRWLERRKELGIESDCLFVSKNKGEWKPAQVSTLNSWALTISKIMGTEYYAHASRHAWTTNLSKQKYPKEIIQKLQSWSSTALVDLYNDNSDEDELASFFQKQNKDADTSD